MSIVFIISAPSGTGKSTLAKAVLATDDRLEFAVSVTTRPPRPNESDGKEYRFVTREEFVAMREREEFLEWAEVYGHCYATPCSAVTHAAAKGQDLLLDIDVQGVASLMSKLPDAVTIFMLPPSKGELAQRLKSRSSDDEGAIARRLGQASAEVQKYRSYSYVVVNDDLDLAIRRVRAIIEAERSKRGQMRAVIEPVLREFGIPAVTGEEIKA